MTRVDHGRRRIVLGAAALVVAITGAVLVDISQPGRESPGRRDRPRGPITGLAQGHHPLGAKWDWSRLAEFTPYLRNLSGGATFYEVVWCDVERSPGARDWSTVDRVLRESQRLGFALHLKIRVGSCWATGGRGNYERGRKNKTESLMPLSLAEYEKFVREVVTRYAPASVKEYAVENEVNSRSMWGGTPEQLADLVTTASEAIRESASEAVVVDSGISSMAYGFGIAARLLQEGRDDEALRSYLAYYERRFSTRGEEVPRVETVEELREALQGEQAQRHVTYLDVVTELADQGIVDVRQLHFYEDESNVPALLEFLRDELPSDMPIEAWEVGAFMGDGATVSDEERAEETVAVAERLLTGGVRRVIWLPLAHDPSGRHADEIRYGLLEPDGRVRPAGEALLALTEQWREEPPG